MRKKNLLLMFLMMVMVLTIYSNSKQAGDHELILMPTGETIPKGSFCFTDYDLFLLKFNYGLTASTQLGLFLPFPITTGAFEYATISIKQQYLKSKSVSASLWLTAAPKIEGMLLGNVFSFGSQATNFHLGLAYVRSFSQDSENEFVYMAGLKQRLSRKMSFLVEYTNFSSFFDGDFAGILSLGVRFHSRTIAVDIGGIRPLEYMEDLLLIPNVKVMIMF